MKLRPSQVMRHLCQWLVLPLALLACLSAPALSADIVNGKAKYTQVCAGCHGADPLANTFNVMYGANSLATIQDQIATNIQMQGIALPVSDLTDVAAYLGSVVIVPQTGYWWNPAEGGRGITLEQNGSSGNVFFATYLYSATGGSTWYAAGPTPVIGAKFTAKLTAYAGGQTLTGAYKPATTTPSPGTVTILFSDSTHATISWPGRTFAIQRYEFLPGGLSSPPTASQPQSGYWWSPAEGGRGYTVEVQNGTAFVAAYMYDASGNPVWYASGPAQLTPDNTYQGNWTSYSGGQTLSGSFQAPTGTSNAGSLTIQFPSPTTATLTLPDGRQIPIQRYNF